MNAAQEAALAARLEQERLERVGKATAHVPNPAYKGLSGVALSEAMEADDVAARSGLNPYWR